MTSGLERVCESVLTRTTPNREERLHIITLAKNLKQKVEAAVKEAGIEAEIDVEGSVAKDTWLRNEPEIDIFMRVPTTVPRKAFGTVYLTTAKKATQGLKQIERFAEHPYLECVINNVRVNIVPCYKVEPGEWISAMDRTPFHTSYITKHLDQQSKNEVRILKQFMRGIDAYGAEIKVGGFSGYLCELLILYYKSFIETIKLAANWKRGVVIDCKGYYSGVEGELKKIFKNHIIVVDPVDKGRNVAAAVREKKLNEFIAASRAFLKNPDLKFFYAQEEKVLDTEKLLYTMKGRKSILVFVRFGMVKTVSDVLWGQLFKSQRALKKMLQKYSFKLIRDEVWSDEKNINIFIFEVGERFLPSLKKHLGPPIERREDCEKFLQKHLGAELTISGPRIEGDRWVIEKKREYTDVVTFITDHLKDGGRHIGIANLLANAIADYFEVLVNEEVLQIYSANDEFAKFLTKYLIGRPGWLV
jgi:tRNA nucleotidyltransferase (CCA-adding enzyme)